MYSVDEWNSNDPGERPDISAHDELEELRRELDDVDSDLLDTVRKRLEVCLRIADVKRRADISMMQPQRIGAVHRHAREFARHHALSPDFFDSLYDVLIAETCRLEDLAINVGASQDGDSPTPTAGEDSESSATSTRIEST